MTALERANELYNGPKKDVPFKALNLDRHICSEVGRNKESTLTAYAIYAQICEGLKCPDELYQYNNFPSYVCVLKRM